MLCFGILIQGDISHFQLWKGFCNKMSAIHNFGKVDYISALQLKFSTFRKVVNPLQMLYGYTRTNPFRIVGKIIMFWKNLIPDKIKRFSLLLESKLIYLKCQFRNHICTLISGTRNFDLFHRKYCSYVRYLLQSEYHLTFSQNFSFSYKYP